MKLSVISYISFTTSWKLNCCYWKKYQLLKLDVLYKREENMMSSQVNGKSEYHIYKLSFDDIEKARTRISDYIHQTPVLTCSSIDKTVNKNCEQSKKKFQLFFKCENLQKTGSFKVN